MAEVTSYQRMLLSLQESAENGLTDLWSTAVAYYQQFPALLSPITVPNIVLHDTASIDSYSQRIVSHYGMASGVPLRVPPGDNRLYDAVSLGLWGTPEKGVELRVRTCLQLVLNRSQYKRHLKLNHHHLLSTSCPLKEACVNVALYRNYNSAWVFLALAQITQKSIQSLYPPINGQDDIMFNTLNTIFCPIGISCQPTVYDLTILWTHTGSANQQIWISNHFVPVISASSCLSRYSSSQNNTDLGTRKKSVRKHHHKNHAQFSSASKQRLRASRHRSSASRHNSSASKNVYRVVFQSKYKSTIILRKVRPAVCRELWVDLPLKSDLRV